MPAVYPLMMLRRLLGQVKVISFGPMKRSCVPSMTTFKLLTRPWTTSRVCAAVTRASSWVSRSNLCSVASISLSPNSFFANFAVPCKAYWFLFTTNHLLKRPCLICLVATASTPSTSAIIFTRMSDMVGASGICSV